MRITTRITFDFDGNVLEHEYYTYSGPVALCDRAAQNTAKNAAGTAAVTGATEAGNAATDRTALTPFYRSEMNAQHGFNPGQTNELLDFAGAGTGGSGATAMGEAGSEAARTRNTSGFSSSLDQNARDRAKQMATVNAGVGAQDVLGAKQLNQEGAAGMSGLYGLDTNAMLQSMGQVAPDVNAETNAGKSGWFQNTLATINALKSGGSGGGGGGGGGGFSGFPV